MEQKQKIEKNGFGTLGIIVIVAAALLIGGGYWGYTFWQKDTYVTPPQIRSEDTSPVQSESIDTSTWKTYRNEQYGFEVKYPPRLSEIKEVHGTYGSDFRGMALAGTLGFITAAHAEDSATLGRPLFDEAYMKSFNQNLNRIFQDGSISGIDPRNVFLRNVPGLKFYSPAYFAVASFRGVVAFEWTPGQGKIPFPDAGVIARAQNGKGDIIEVVFELPENDKIRSFREELASGESEDEWVQRVGQYYSVHAKEDFAAEISLVKALVGSAKFR